MRKERKYVKTFLSSKEVQVRRISKSVTSGYAQLQKV